MFAAAVIYLSDSKLSLTTEEHHPTGLVHAHEINLFDPQDFLQVSSSMRL
ncbi:MAG: hypothetical protein HOP30_13935 [Cyclobacteriaceae bacterium]|nr:hypothetical protein [Cyclobacteriaceae bacterium]